MAATLVGSSAFEDFAESVENFGGPPGLLSDEIVDVFHHEPEIDLILEGRPSSGLYFLFIDLNAEFFHMMVIRLEAFLIRAIFLGIGSFQRFGKIQG